MSRTFQDRSLLTWDAFPSASRRGMTANPLVIFHCAEDRRIRPRCIELPGHVADAERAVRTVPVALLQQWLDASQEVV